MWVFNLHEVDSNSHSCSDEHDVSIDVEVLVNCPLNRLIEQHGRQNVDEHHTEDCRYHLYVQSIFRRIKTEAVSKARLQQKECA